MTNFVLVVVSLMGCSAGACLLAFYQIHLLTFISLEFVIVPLVLIGKPDFIYVVSLELKSNTMSENTKLAPETIN